MNFLNRLRQFLTTPIFPEDDEKTRQARVLHTLVLNLGAAILLALTLGNLFIFVEKFITTLLLVTSLGLVLLSNGLMHQGRVRAGSMVIVLTLWGITTALAAVSGGMRSYHVMLYLPGTISAGLLLGLPGSLVFGLTALGSGLIMTILANNGFVFPSRFAYPTGSIWVILLVSVIAILLPLSITLRSLAEALARAHQELDERKHAEETAQRRANQNALLYQLGISAASGQDLYATLFAIQQRLIQLIQADAFYIAIYDAATDVVSYPVFFSEGKPFSDSHRRLSAEPGLTGAVIFNRQTLYLPDILTDMVEATYRPVNTNDLILHTFLGVPLSIKDRVIGMLSVQSQQIDAYNAEQIQLVEAIAAQAVVAIDKARLLEQLQAELAERARAEQAARQRADETTLLYNLSIAISAREDLYQVLSSLLDYMQRLFVMSSFYVGLYDDQTNTLEFPLFWNDGQLVQVEKRDLKDIPGLSGEVIFKAETLYLADLEDPEQIQGIQVIGSAPSRNRSFIGIPLISQEHVIGIISMQSAIPNAYAPEQVRLAEAIASQASIAIQRAQLHEQLQAELGERKLAEQAVRAERDQLARRRAAMEKVLELGKAVAQITDLRECLRVAHQVIQLGLGFDRVGLFLYDKTTDTIRGVFGTDRQGMMLDTSWYTHRASDYSAWQQALIDPSGITLVDDYQTARQFDPSDEMYGVKQHVTLAAWAGDTPVALITVDNLVSQRTITTEQIEALRLLAGYIGLSIRNAELNDELERRVKERTAQLEAAMSELDSFSFSVAHDLRAPLRGMRGFSQIVLEENSNRLDDRSRNHLQRITTSAKQMGELIDALLDFSRLTRLDLNREEVNLSMLAYDIMAGLKRAEPKRAVNFEIRDGLTARADKRLLRIVLENLINNAWKFTSKKAYATISFGQEIQKDVRVYYVRDNGAGFNMDYAGKLFGAFQRLHHPDEFPGHGAGLAIVQRIIKKHGGRIWAEGIVEHGATFYFTLE